MFYFWNHPANESTFKNIVKIISYQKANYFDDSLLFNINYPNIKYKQD